MQGDTTKLKEYMKTLNLLPHKRKRKDALLKSPVRSPRSSPRSCATGAPHTHYPTCLLLISNNMIQKACLWPLRRPCVCIKIQIRGNDAIFQPGLIKD